MNQISKVLQRDGSWLSASEELLEGRHRVGEEVLLVREDIEGTTRLPGWAVREEASMPTGQETAGEEKDSKAELQA